MSWKATVARKSQDRLANAEVLRLIERGMSYREVAERLGVSKSSVGRIVKSESRGSPPSPAAPPRRQEPEPPEKERKKPVRIGHIDAIDRPIDPGIVTRVILTSAQDDTQVFEPFWENLKAYADYIGASISVGGYTYQLGLYEDHAVATAVYAPELREYLTFERIRAGNVLIVSDANVLPTTANPLSGWLTINSGNHVAIPHARVALQSIPRMTGSPPRYCVSTGTVTRPSYTPRAAGRKAVHHHTYGALLVEFDADGEVFFRHLLADVDGSFQDLNTFVQGNIVHEDCRVKTITWGDVHHEQLDGAIAKASWGYDAQTKRIFPGDSVLDKLKPELQFLHDTIDFRRRNHHDVRDPHRRAQVLQSSSGSVGDEIKEAAHFVNQVRRPWCSTVVIESNHDAALAKWLKDPEGAADPVNAEYWHARNFYWHRAIRMHLDDYNVVHDALRKAGLANDVLFVPSGKSLSVNGIEHGLHGDVGIGGSKGSPMQYRRLGPKVTSAHTHTPQIVDGVYVAGLSGSLDQGYNSRGPTTWAHAHVVGYGNGKRTLLCMSADGRWKAGMTDVEEIGLAA